MKRHSWIYGIGAIAGAAAFAALAFWMKQAGPGPIGFDASVQEKLLEMRTDGLTQGMKLVGQLGTEAVFAIGLLLAGAVLIAKRRVPEALLLLVQLAVAFGFYKGLKALFERPRPDIEQLTDASGYSFPSGNALMGAAFYLFAGLLLSRLPKLRRSTRGLIAAISILIVLAVGFSRLYLGVHYTTDILAGYAAGFALFGLMAVILNRFVR